MQFLKANTAVDVLIGPFVDDTDGKTAETALTLSQADIKLSKNGQTLAQKSDVTAAAHDANGYYNCELDTTDTNTEGTITLIVHETGALPVRHEYMVLAEAAYDSLFAAKDTGYMDVNIKAISEDTTAADNAELAFDGTGYGFTNCTIPTVTTLTGHTVQTGDTYPLASGAAGFSAINTDVEAILVDTGTTLPATLTTIEGKVDTVDGIVDNILVDTAVIGALGAGLTAIPWNSAWDAEVQSECADALTAIHLDHLLATDYDPASKPGTATALLNELVENDVGVSRFTENALEQAPSGTGASAATIADAVWDEAQADHVGAGTFGVVASEVADILADTNELQADDTPGAIAALNNVSSANVTTACTNSLNTYDPPTRAELTTDTNSVITQVNANETKIDIIDTNVDSVLVDTGELQTDWTNGGRLDLLVDAIKAVTDAIPNAGVMSSIAQEATVAALNNISAADVNAQVVDVLKTDTAALPGQGAPTATPTLEVAIMYLYKFMRNKIVTSATEVKVYADNGTTVDQKSTISDDATDFTRGEFGTGA